MGEVRRNDRSLENRMTTARTIPVWKNADDLSTWFVTDLDSHALDVVVVGAGIAGLSAALCLLR